jgi:hypothetical protein
MVVKYARSGRRLHSDFLKAFVLNGDDNVVVV